MSFQKRLQAKEFVVLAEMHTPKGVNTTRLVTDARRIKGRVDAIVVPGMDNGIMRMSALAGAVLMQQQGVEAIMHLYCRDRNRMALQGDILAAQALGVQNLIVAHSEEMELSDHREARPVDDLDEVALIGAVETLKSGKDLAGFDLDGAPLCTVGCTLPPCADQAMLEQELSLLKQKVAAGAAFVITPPIFDLEYFSSLLDKIKPLGVPVIPTIFLLKSLAIAQYIATNEPSAGIADDLIRRIRKAADREQEGIKIAGETVAALKSMTEGVLVQTLGWEHRLPAILDIAGL
jgi:methylenetetrahydrofolate reductase (NADPH)